MAVTIGKKVRYATYIKSSADNLKHTFRYTVVSPDNDSDGVKVGNLIVNSGVQDAVGNRINTVVKDTLINKISVASESFGVVGPITGLVVDQSNPTQAPVSLGSKLSDTSLLIMLVKTNQTINLNDAKNFVTLVCNIAGQIHHLRVQTINSYGRLEIAFFKGLYNADFTGNLSATGLQGVIFHFGVGC